MSIDAFYRYVADDGFTEFRWHGGAYIEVGPAGEEWQAHDVINVWDYAEDRPTIARTLEAFQEHCDEWLARQDREE